MFCCFVCPTAADAFASLLISCVCIFPGVSIQQSSISLSLYGWIAQHACDDCFFELEFEYVNNSCAGWCNGRRDSTSCTIFFAIFSPGFFSRFWRSVKHLAKRQTPKVKSINFSNLPFWYIESTQYLRWCLPKCQDIKRLYSWPLNETQQRLFFSRCSTFWTWLTGRATWVEHNLYFICCLSCTIVDNLVSFFCHTIEMI